MFADLRTFHESLTGITSENTRRTADSNTKKKLWREVVGDKAPQRPRNSTVSGTDLPKYCCILLYFFHLQKVFFSTTELVFVLDVTSRIAELRVGVMEWLSRKLWTKTIIRAMYVDRRYAIVLATPQFSRAKAEKIHTSDVQSVLSASVLCSTRWHIISRSETVALLFAWRWGSLLQVSRFIFLGILQLFKAVPEHDTGNGKASKERDSWGLRVNNAPSPRFQATKLGQLLLV